MWRLDITYSLILTVLVLHSAIAAENSTNTTTTTTTAAAAAAAAVADAADKLNSTKTNEVNIETTTIKLLLKQEVSIENNKPVNVSITRTVNNNSTNGDQVQLAGVEVESKPGSAVISYFKQLFKSKSVIGDNCTTQEDCDSKGSLCLEGTCQCQEGFVAALDRWHCLPVVRSIGDQCLQDAQCYEGLNVKEGDAKCISFRCVCGTSTIYRSGTCIKTIYLGDKCINDNDCLTANSRCLQGVCACPMDMVPGAEDKQCLPAIKSLDHSNCSQDDQCQQFMGDSSLCHQGKCLCKPRTHFNRTICTPDLKLGESCSKQSDCITASEDGTGSERDCINGLCTCPPNFKEITEEDSCFNAASISCNTISVILMVIISWILI